MYFFVKWQHCVNKIVHGVFFNCFSAEFSTPRVAKKGLKLYWQNTFWLPFNIFICFPVMLVIVMKQ